MYTITAVGNADNQHRQNTKVAAMKLWADLDGGKRDGDHFSIPQDIPAGQYVVSVSEDASGQIVLDFTPGVVTGSPAP